jgi:hypothetical protein
MQQNHYSITSSARASSSGGGFRAPVSARHFPISFWACRRPVRYVTETGSRSGIAGVERDAGVKSAASEECLTALNDPAT